MKPELDKEELKKFTSPRKLIAYLRRTGYDTKDLLVASMKYKRTRKPDKTYNQISVDWIISYIFGNKTEKA